MAYYVGLILRNRLSKTSHSLCLLPSYCSLIGTSFLLLEHHGSRIRELFTYVADFHAEIGIRHRVVSVEKDTGTGIRYNWVGGLIASPISMK